MKRSSQIERPADRHGQRGTALIELAFTLPILLLLVLGVGFFGRVLYHSILVSNAARAGTGYGTRHYADVGGMRDAAATDAQVSLPAFKADTTNVPVATFFCRCPGEAVPACGTRPPVGARDGCMDGTALRQCTGYGPVRVYVQVETAYTFNTFGLDSGGNAITVCLPGSLCIPSQVTLAGCSIVRTE